MKQTILTPTQQLFLDNAFFFLNHAAMQIMETPKIALAEVPFESGTAQTGGFRPTLGALVDWWHFSGYGMILNTKEKKISRIIYALSGSILSGANVCHMVDEQAVTTSKSLQEFHTRISKLCETNREYKEKYLGIKPCTLEEAVRILKEEPSEE